MEEIMTDRRVPGIVRIVLAVTVFALLLPTLAAAQERDWNRVDDPMFEAIGLHLGLATGTGLAYKFPVRWWLYAQVAGGIWNTKDDKRHNLGVELQYILRAQGRDKVYLGAGFGHYYHKKEDAWTKDNVNSMFGVGIERLFNERTALQVEVDFLYQSDDDTVILLPQVGAFFYF